MCPRKIGPDIRREPGNTPGPANRRSIYSDPGNSPTRPAGYVVFSVEHFGFNQSKMFPDGTPFVADTLGFPGPTGDFMKDARAAWGYLGDQVFKIWRADAQFTVDQPGLPLSPRK